jgi:hypothetical protein
VESCWALDVNDLRDCLRPPGLFTTRAWHDGNGGIFSIHLRYAAEQKLLYLSYTLPALAGNGDRSEDRSGEQNESGAQNESGKQKEVIESIAIVHEPCRYGGARPYFLCPGIEGVGGGVDSAAAGVVRCGRRVGKLYLAQPIYGRRQGYFLCRRCGQVVYAAKYERPWQRTSRRANKLRQRLGITALGAADRPKGMLVRTYARLLEAALAAEIRETEAGTKRILQLAAQIERRRKASSPPSFTL